MSAATILIIDDDAHLAAGLAAVLRRYGYQVLAADNGKAGLEMARTHRPDLILCDVMMPPPNGFEVRRQLDWFPEVAHTPFIFLSALNALPDRLTGLELGADDYISKPFDRDELLARVGSVLRRVERERERGGQLAEAQLVHEPAEACLLADAQGVLQLLNPAAARLLGAPTAELLIGQDFLEWVAPESRAACAAGWQAALSGAEMAHPLYVRWKSVDGVYRPVELRLKPARWRGGPAALIGLRLETGL